MDVAASRSVDTTNAANSTSFDGVNEGNYLNGVMLFAAAWNTVLADQVIFDLLLDPFGFLVFPNDDLMSEMVGAAAATRSTRTGAHGFPR
jgi:hypothetical protein